ncbi:MAG: adenosylmethionine decarboxylase [Candidatus Aenigmatarchaeota archaeon]
MKIKHLAARLEDCGVERRLLSDKVFAFGVLDEVVKKLGMTYIDKVYYKFKPEGLSVLYLIQQSHIAMHTWPEYSFIDVEIVTCKEDSDVEKGLEVIIKSYKPQKIEKCYWEYSI